MFKPRPRPVDAPDSGGWPPEFDAAFYTRHPANADLRLMGAARAARHYREHGRREGRVCCPVATRVDMLRHIAADAEILEIGPFFSPVFSTADRAVRYADVLSADALRARAATIPRGDPAGVPEIDYVCPSGPLSAVIDARFDVVFSSHNIEHQTCLISHLADLSALLKPGGSVVLFIPDRRFCFDHYLPATTLADILGAWFEPSDRHRGVDVARHWLFATHNNSGAHWAGEHGPDPFQRPPTPELGAHLRVRRDEYQAIKGYVDVHAWQFAPGEFRHLVGYLHACGLTDLAPVRVYETVQPAIEFYAVLQKA